MKLSTRSRYGIRALLELALNYNKGPMQIKAIAEREKISNKYLEQLISLLKTRGLVQSVRGPKGGYILAKSPAEIKLSEVFMTLEGPVMAFSCPDHKNHSPSCGDCLTKKLWVQMENAINGVLTSISLKDMVEDAIGSKKTHS
jgi:Rrf2 family transcriptional regulator, cysteine metabolism repressor